MRCNYDARSDVERHCANAHPGILCQVLFSVSITRCNIYKDTHHKVPYKDTQNQHEFRFYGDQELFLKLPARSSSKVKKNPPALKVLGGCILSGPISCWPICRCPLQAEAQQANGSKDCEF